MIAPVRFRHPVKNLVTILCLAAILCGVALAERPRVGPRVQRLAPVTGEEQVGSIKSTRFMPIRYSPGPGDSIGFTGYDYGTNGSANRNLINFGDGQLSAARMCAVDPLIRGTVTRGSYFRFFDGVQWSTEWERVEGERRGWTNIDQFSDAGGAEAIISHLGLEANVDAARGANVWSSMVFGGTGQLWPRMAIGSGLGIHVIYQNFSPGDVTLYAYSPDAGTTWTVDQEIFANPGYLPSADAYDITARGSKVAAVGAGPNSDVVVVESMDGGTTWNEYVIYDIDNTLMTPDEEPPDGSVSAFIDEEGNLHIAWGSYLSVGDGLPYHSVDAGIRHWSAATGVQEVALPDPDPSIGLPVGRNGNYVSNPDLCGDATGGVQIIFVRMINEIDAQLNYYQHVFAVGSPDGGMTWSEPVDATPGTGFDASFPTVADLSDENIHMLYFSDPYAGNALQGNHCQVSVALMYLRTPKGNLLPLHAPITGRVVPVETALLDNYPNPFNPVTTISYDLPVAGQVSLVVTDIVGREVARLVDGYQEAGYRSVTFDGSNLASGIYFYRLQARPLDQTLSGGQAVGFVETKKLLLLR